MSPHNAHACLGLLAFALLSTSASRAAADGPPVAPDLAPADASRAAPNVPPDASAPPTAPAAPTEFLQVSHPARVAAFIFGGVALVGVGVGTGFGIEALHEKSQFNPRTSSVSAANLGNQNAVVSDVGFGAAVIAGVTSIVLFLKDEPADHPKEPRPVSFTVSPIASPHGAGAGAVLRF